MKRIFISWLFVWIGLASVFLGCNTKQENDNGQVHTTNENTKVQEEETHDDELAGATFEEGKGIHILDEAKESMGLECLIVNAKSEEFSVEVNAQVYRLAEESSNSNGEQQGNAYATALIPSVEVSGIRIGQTVCFLVDGNLVVERAGSIWKVETIKIPSLGKAELLFALPDPEHQLKIGDFVKLRIPVENATKEIISIPKTALLETVQGFYVFIQKGDFFQRQEVKIGSQNSETIEIKEGLKSGDVIVVKPVQILHLIELKATKGGGHGH